MVVCSYGVAPLMLFGMRVTKFASCGMLTRETGSWPISEPVRGSPISFRGCPVLENLLAGHPYLDLFKCRSISHLLEKAFPHDGHLCVPL